MRGKVAAVVAALPPTAAITIVACTWAFATARYGGPDEPAHVIRAAAAAHGDLIGRPVEGFEPGYREVTVVAPLATGDPACFRHSETTTAACTATSNQDGDRGVATSAGSAPPWYYLPVGAIARAFSAGREVIGHRMAAVLLCSLILGYAFARARSAGIGPWLLVALTPSAWFLLGVVGTSGIEIALVLLCLVEALRRYHVDSQSSAIERVTVPLSVCLILRPTALIDVALVALVLAPTLRFSPRQIGRATIPLFAAGGAWLAWNQWADVTLSDRRTADARSLSSAIRHSLDDIPTNAHQAIGALGWNEFFAPLAAQLIWVAMLAFAVYSVVRRSPWWHATWFAAALLLPVVVEAFIHRNIGLVWQGRYSIVFAMGGVLFAARFGPPNPRLARTVLTAAVVGEVLTLWWTLRRYMVGLNGSLTLRGAAWQPPVNPWLLIAVNAIALAGLTGLMLNPSSGHVAKDVDDVVGGAGVVVDRQLASGAELQVGEVRHG